MSRRRKAIFWIVSVLSAVSGSLAPAAEASAGVDGAEVVRRWTFRSAEDLRGWEPGGGIADLRVEDGRLRARLASADAFIFAPPVDVPMDGLAVRVRWSSQRGGTCQCFWTARESPAFGEDKVMNREVEAGSVETEFDLDPGSGPVPTLTRFRLDPFNGRPGDAFEIEEAALVRLLPRIDVGFAPVKPAAAVGEKVKFRAWARRLRGRRPQGDLEAAIDGAGAVGNTLRFPAGGEASLDLAFDAPGVHIVKAVVSREGKRTHELDAAIAVGLPREPGGEKIESGGVAVELLPRAGPGNDRAGGRLWLREGEAWRDAGLLLPIAEVVVEEDGVVRRTVPQLLAPFGEFGPDVSPEMKKVMTSRLTLQPRDYHRGQGPMVTLQIGFGPDLPELMARGVRVRKGEAIAVEASVRVLAGTRLLRFAGPAVRRIASGPDPLDRHGIFGGLEFLEPGWRSSSDRGVGTRFAARWTPAPWKVALPVMAVEMDGITTAVLWNPGGDPTWRSEPRLPAATFASPDALEGQEASHRMVLSLPPVGDGRRENEDLAETPFPGGTIRMAVHVAREPALLAARRWYEHYRIPQAPGAPTDRSPRSTPRPDSTTYDLLARCYGETVWWPGERGWKHHWFTGERSAFHPSFAAELLLHARITGEKKWVEATGIAGRGVIDTEGTLWSRAHGGAAGADRSIAAMREDGTYGYHEPPIVKEQTRQASGGKLDSLGPEGATTLGTCVQGALPLLRHLLFSGDPKYLEPARKALAAMRRFRAPRGAQVWEVPLEGPDIRAAALAVEAYHIGWIATGDPTYLDDAFYWANAGLPFIYSWRVPRGDGPARARTSRDRDDASKTEFIAGGEVFTVPRRQVTPYGTVPVMSTTFYASSWFGVIVQWCGLEWAWKVGELLEERDDPILRAAAEGVAASGLQQMFEKAPWTGLYPDVWNVDGNWAGGALIAPDLLIRALRAGGRLPFTQALRVWSRRAGDGPTALLVHGWGKPLRCERAGDDLVVEAEFAKDETWEVLVARSPRPKAVEADGKAIPEGEAGWRHDAAGRLLGVRCVPSGNRAAVRIRF